MARDLFEGRSVDTIDDGVAYAESVGLGQITDRGVASVEGIEDPVVVIATTTPAHREVRNDPRYLA